MNQYENDAADMLAAAYAENEGKEFDAVCKVLAGVMQKRDEDVQFLISELNQNKAAWQQAQEILGQMQEQADKALSDSERFTAESEAKLVLGLAEIDARYASKKEVLLKDVMQGLGLDERSAREWLACKELEFPSATPSAALPVEGAGPLADAELAEFAEWFEEVGKEELAAAERFLEKHNEGPGAAAIQWVLSDLPGLLARLTTAAADAAPAATSVSGAGKFIELFEAAQLVGNTFDDFSQDVDCAKCAPVEPAGYNAARLRCYEALKAIEPADLVALGAALAASPASVTGPQTALDEAESRGWQKAIDLVGDVLSGYRKQGSEAGLDEVTEGYMIGRLAELIVEAIEKHNLSAASIPVGGTPPSGLDANKVADWLLDHGRTLFDDVHDGEDAKKVVAFALAETLIENCGAPACSVWQDGPTDAKPVWRVYTQHYRSAADVWNPAMGLGHDNEDDARKQAAGIIKCNWHVAKAKVMLEYEPIEVECLNQPEREVSPPAAHSDGK